MTDGGGATVRPYGAWPSPFSIDLLSMRVLSLMEPMAAGGVRWWLEGRPEEGGRQVLMRLGRSGGPVRLTPEGFNARTRVHEYGGAPYLVDEEVIVVSDFATGRLHRVIEPEVLAPLTPEGRAWRFADVVLDRGRRRLIGVREDHEPATLEAHGEAVNVLVTIDLHGGAVAPLVSGADFYGSPRLSPDGTQLAWLEWDHPNMPWDGCRLRVAEVETDGRLGEPVEVAGGPDLWVSEPRWSPAGVLHYASESSGWLNLHRWLGGERVEALAELLAEFSAPAWQFGVRTYDFLPDGTVVAIGASEGRDRLFRLGVEPGLAVEIPTEFTSLAWLSIDDDTVVAWAASPERMPAIIELDPASAGWRTLRRSAPPRFEPGDVAVPEHVEFPTAGGATAYGLFYEPTNHAVRGPDGERPPLIVTSHGGPTSRARHALTPVIQLFTSRGFAVLDVDYGGSTGYGREYRRRLEGRWGIVDVEDCVAGARWLAERGLVDGERRAIRGGSASGYTTLCALTFGDEFRAGVSYYGLGNLEAFVAETHKFESRYLERLIGPWPAAAETYRERSPILHCERIGCPVLVLQGLDDRIVPPSEAERIVAALAERRIPHAYLAFEGEDHGFRKPATIRRAFEAELSFYGQVFGFEPADELEPIEIAFLDQGAAGGVAGD